MTVNELSIGTLRSNAIKQFVLRVDFLSDCKALHSEIIKKIAKKFDRVEHREVTNISFKFEKDGDSLESAKAIDYVLVSDSRSISVTFSEVHNAFWIESSQYLDRSTYRDTLESIVEAYIDADKDIIYKRIGIRFINEFKCHKSRDIQKVFSGYAYSNIKNILKNEFLIRAIVVEEYNNGSNKSRIQYGIPNKYYPSLITNNDLLLDIDCYDDAPDAGVIGGLSLLVSNLNHAAQGIFLRMINPKHLDELR